MKHAAGHLFIISAPSGAGKTTLCRAVMDEFEDLRYSISHTTRPPRGSEKHGLDYFFMEKDEFLAGIKENRWAEWALVHDNYYGTSSEFLTKSLSSGCSILLDIDVQGTEQILKAFPSAITVFIMPPSLEALKSRLESRGTENPETIEKRLINANQEIQKKHIYQHVVINDDLQEAIIELIAIFRKFI